jgi:hypothetical protein
LPGRSFRGGIAAAHTAIQKQVPLFVVSAEQNVASRGSDFIAKYGSSPVDRAVEVLNGEGKSIEASLTTLIPCFLSSRQ